MDEVKRIRRERGLSQRRLAELAGVNKVTLVHIETGKSSPNVETLEKLADALEVEVADFFPKSQSALFPPDAEQRRAEELGRAWAQRVREIQMHREDILQRRLADATSGDDRTRAVGEFQAAYIHASVLIKEGLERFPTAGVDELVAALEAWRENLLSFYVPPGRRVSPEELKALEEQILSGEAESTALSGRE